MSTTQKQKMTFNRPGWKSSVQGWHLFRTGDLTARTLGPSEDGFSPDGDRDEFLVVAHRIVESALAKIPKPIRGCADEYLVHCIVNGETTEIYGNWQIQVRDVLTEVSALIGEETDKYRWPASAVPETRKLALRGAEAA